MAKVINADEKNDRIEPEEAITHNTADRTDVMTGDLDLWPFDPKINEVSWIHRETFMCHVLSS